jgi:hypothetical protein
MTLPVTGYVQQVEVVVGGTLPRAGYVQPVEAASGLPFITGSGAAGQITFWTGAQTVSGSNSLTWDNTTRIMGVGSNTGTCIQLMHRFTGDGLTPGPVDGSGYVNIIEPTSGRTLSMGFYTFGELIRFMGNQAGLTESGLEFWGVDNIAAPGAASPIVTMVCGTTAHEVHCPRGNTDIDAIILAYPVGSTPVIYTETGGNNVIDLGVSRKRLFRLTTSAANGTGNVLWSSTGSSSGVNLIHEFRDNGFAGTLVGSVAYNGANGAGNKSISVANFSGDYLGLHSDTTIFFNGNSSVEYARWTSTDLRPGTTNSFDFGTTAKLWKSIYFGTQAIGPVGSAGAPSFTFIGTTDGFYSRASGALDISIGGGRTVEIDGANIYIVVNGSSYSLGSLNDCTFSRDANGNAILTSTARQIAFATAAKGTGDTIGYMCIPSSAGAPTGTPSNIPTGQIPYQIDSTALKLYAYIGGWKKAQVAGVDVIFG